MANVAEDVTSGMRDSHQQAEILHDKRMKNIRTLNNLETLAVEQYRKFMEGAQHFTVDLRGNINSIVSELGKAISNVSSSLRENILKLSEV